MYAGVKEKKLVTNNMIIINKSSSTFGTPIGINSYSNDTVLIAYNSIYINTNDTLGYPISSTSTDFTYLYNNQLIHKGGGLCYFVDGNTSGFFKSDYNDLYNFNHTLAKYNNNLYNNITTISSQLNIEQHSISVNPNFLNDSVLIPYNPLIFDHAIPIAAIDHDYYNNTRQPTTTDIGAYEGDPAQYDIGIIGNSFSNYIPCPYDSVPFYIKIKNFGTQTLTSAEIRCKSLDSMDYHINWTGNLSQNHTKDSIFIGYFSFSKKEKIEIKAWVYNPNGYTDNVNQNDTTVFTTYAAMNGNYSIGTGLSDYITLNSAVNDLIKFGVCGPVVFNISPGTYNEQIEIPYIKGTSSINTVTFKSANSDSNSVNIQFYALYSSTNYIIKLTSTNFIHIQNITVQPLGSTYCNGIVLYNSNYNVISNNKILFTSYYSYTVASNLLSLYGNNNIISNNRFLNGYNQLDIEGTGTRGNSVSLNSFEGLCYRNIYVVNQGGMRIYKNNFTGSTSGVIELKTCNDSIIIDKNKINIKGMNLLLINIHSCNATVQNPIVIKNNFISANASGYASYIFLDIVSNLKILNNNFYLKNTSDICLNVSSYFSFCSNIYFQNNLISCKDSALFYLLPTLNNAIFHSNFNSFYSLKQNPYSVSPTSGSSNIGYSFTSWQTSTGLDQQSLFTLPYFVNDSNLHVQNTTAIKGKGTPFPEVPDDIDDETRNILTPDIGADEFPIDSSSYYDVSISKVIYPDTQICFKTDSLKIKIRNHSNFPITSLDVKWTLFGLNPITKHIVLNLNKYDTAYINLGYFEFVPHTLYQFDFEVSNLNNHVDNYPANNTFTTQYSYLGNVKIFKKLNSECNNNTELYIKNFPRNTVLWSNGSSQNSIIVTSPGTYNVTVTGTNGCIVTDSIILN